MKSAAAHLFARRLAEAITALTGKPCICNAHDLVAARGWYRTDIHADVMRWTGFVTLDGVSRSVGSWEPMTAALKHGFDLDYSPNDFRAYADIEVSVPEYVHPFNRKATS